MIDVKLEPRHNRFNLCLQSMRRVVRNVLVPSSRLETSPSARFHRSKLLPPWSAREEGDDRWGHLVSDHGFQNEFFLFQRWMNSVCFCYFCVDLFRAPKIMKIFVWSLYGVYYLGKIWNVVFQQFLNVIKIAQLINKWVSMIFSRLIYLSKNYENCFAT